MARLVRIILAASLLAACSGGSGQTVAAPGVETTAEIDCESDQLVDAADVEVTGRRVEAVAGIILSTDQLTDGQRKVVSWSLTRFDEAGLRLPPKIDVVFDETLSMCHGDMGQCHPDQGIPVLYVCGIEEPTTSADVLDRKLVLLHELAHIWHWAQGEGTSWPDYSNIVGGEHTNGTVPAFDRTEERVAMIISWGLLDQVDRPVLDNMSCEARYLMFQTLTGHPPIGPLDPSCIPA